MTAHMESDCAYLKLSLSIPVKDTESCWGKGQGVLQTLKDFFLNSGPKIAADLDAKSGPACGLGHNRKIKAFKFIHAFCGIGQLNLKHDRTLCRTPEQVRLAPMGLGRVSPQVTKPLPMRCLWQGLCSSPFIPQAKGFNAARAPGRYEGRPQTGLSEVYLFHGLWPFAFFVLRLWP